MRRMSVSTHPTDGVVVVSLWHGQTCTGTFRLPIADAARLIAALADGMAVSLVEASSEPSGPRRGGWRSLPRWVRRQFPWPPAGRPGDLRLLK